MTTYGTPDITELSESLEHAVREMVGEKDELRAALKSLLAAIDYARTVFPSEDFSDPEFDPVEVLNDALEDEERAAKRLL